MTIKLSPNQKKIVKSNNGALLIKASAGSGKTRVLTERIKFLLDKTKRKILAITFTNKASEEIKERLSDIEDLPKRLFVGTFHGFCKQILEKHFKLIGYNQMPHVIENEADRLMLLEEILLSDPNFKHLYNGKTAKQQNSKLYSILNLFSEAKRKRIAIDDESDFGLIYNSYQSALSTQNMIDFDDLILLTCLLFENNSGVNSLYRRTYEYICIDEAQDLNSAQYQLVKILTGENYKNIMMVGDPNQSIFAFNGSSAKYMEKRFVKDYDPKIIELKENYRSAKKILQAANKIIEVDSSLIENSIIEGKFILKNCSDEKAEAKWIFKKIGKLLSLKTVEDIEGGVVTYEKIAVLARNKYIFKELENKFNQKEIPYYYKTSPGAIQFETQLMQRFNLAFKVKINPKDDLHFQFLKELLNVDSGNNLSEIQQTIEDNCSKNVLNTILSLKEDGSNFIKEINTLKDDIESSIKDENEKLMFSNDVDELLNHWKNYAKNTDRKALINFKNSIALGQTYAKQINKEGITLSTVHAMKGLEYDIVFLIGLDDGTFPDYRAIKKGGKALKQEKNNLYVAFTRAKRHLYVSYPEQRLMPWEEIKKRKRSSLLNKFD